MLSQSSNYCGEAYYCGERCAGGSLSSPQELLTFLDIDSNASSLKSKGKDRLASIRKAKAMTLSCYKQSCIEEQAMIKVITLSITNVLSSISGRVAMYRNAIIESQKHTDSVVMKLILHYYSVLREELTLTRSTLYQDHLDSLIVRRRFNMMKDIRIFAEHLSVESKNRICLNELSFESSQAKRCKKAVKENMSKAFLNTQGSFQVLKLYKLEHILLSSHLHNAASSVENGKVKGLFCHIPKDLLFSFCTYGLHIQQVPAVHDQLIPDDLNSIFQLPWFCAKPPSYLKMDSKLLSFSTFLDKNINSSKKRNDSTPNSMTGRLASKRVTDFRLRFSRHSTPKGIGSCSKEELEEGIFISLCRVLLYRVSTINDDIDDNDIEAALKHGCDAVYSTTTEEYVLLKPENVLPEFMMHIHFPHIDNNQVKGSTSSRRKPDINNDSTNGIKASWLPDAMNSSYSSSQRTDTYGNHSPKHHGNNSMTVADLFTQNIASCKNHRSKPSNQNKPEANGSPTRSLLSRKQNLVIAIEAAIDEFKSKKVEHMKHYMK